MPSGTEAVGIVFLALGLLGLLVPELVIRRETRWELVGMRNAEDVEPTTWYVELNRLLGLLMVLGGFLAVGGPSYVV